MAKICPETNDYVLYLDCQECETKSCMNIEHDADGHNINEREK